MYCKTYFIFICTLIMNRYLYTLFTWRIILLHTLKKITALYENNSLTLLQLFDFIFSEW